MFNTGNLDLSSMAVPIQTSTELFQNIDLYFQDDAYEDIYSLLWAVSYQTSDLN